MDADPDGFMGLLLAIEGIYDARAVLNSPTGCRGFPAYFSDKIFPRDNYLNRRNYDEYFFFGQSRIPCTYLDSEDYIKGSADKLREIIPFIEKKGSPLLAIVNSPGASLIGDDISRFLEEANLTQRCMVFEEAPYSSPLSEGFDRGIRSILAWMKLNPLPRSDNRVNILGISMYHKHWKGTVRELTHLCELMGLNVVSSPGAGSYVAEIRESTTASCNLVIFPEYARRTSDWYESEFGIPAVISPQGAPIGFDSTEEWIRQVAKATGRDPKIALDEIRKKKTEAFHQIGRLYSESSYIKGSTFAVRSNASFALPLIRWLYTYLCMLPVSVEIMPGRDEFMDKNLQSYLTSIGMSDILKTDIDLAKPDFYFAEGIAGSHVQCSGACKKAFEITNRVTGDTEFIQKTFLGGEGALYILELLFSALKENAIYE